jgi:hypothetical protein
MFSSRDLIAVEVERPHSTQQKVGCFGAMAHEFMEFSGRDTYVLGYTLYFVLSAAFQLRQRRAPSHPIPPPSRNSFERQPAFLATGKG